VDGRGRSFVFRRDEDKTIGRRDLRGPFLYDVVFVRRPARHCWRHGLVEEGHGEVAKIEKPRINTLPLTKLPKNPLRRFFREAALTGAADDH
jgi:hypothetical protein